jgi:hypothetical protein
LHGPASLASLRLCGATGGVLASQASVAPAGGPPTARDRPRVPCKLLRDRGGNTQRLHPTVGGTSNPSREEPQGPLGYPNWPRGFSILVYASHRRMVASELARLRNIGCVTLAVVTRQCSEHGVNKVGDPPWPTG